MGNQYSGFCSSVEKASASSSAMVTLTILFAFIPLVLTLLPLIFLFSSIRTRCGGRSLQCMGRCLARLDFRPAYRPVLISPRLLLAGGGTTSSFTSSSSSDIQQHQHNSDVDEVEEAEEEDLDADEKGGGDEELADVHKTGLGSTVTHFQSGAGAGAGAGDQSSNCSSSSSSSTSILLDFTTLESETTSNLRQLQQRARHVHESAAQDGKNIPRFMTRGERTSSGGYVTIMFLALVALSCWWIYVTLFSPLHSNIVVRQVRLPSIPSPAKTASAPFRVSLEIMLPCLPSDNPGGCPPGLSVTAGNITHHVDIANSFSSPLPSGSADFDVYGVLCERVSSTRAKLSWNMLVNVPSADFSNIIKFQDKSRIHSNDNFATVTITSWIRSPNSQDGKPQYRAFSPSSSTEDLLAFSDACIGLWTINTQESAVSHIQVAERRYCSSSVVGPRLMCQSSWGSAPYSDAGLAFNPHAIFTNGPDSGSAGRLELVFDMEKEFRLDTSIDSPSFAEFAPKLSGILGLFIALHPIARAGLHRLRVMVRRRRRTGQGIGMRRGLVVAVTLSVVFWIYTFVIAILVVASTTRSFSPQVPRFADARDVDNGSGLSGLRWAITVGYVTFGVDLGFFVIMLVFGLLFLGRDSSDLRARNDWNHEAQEPFIANSSDHRSPIKI